LKLKKGEFYALTPRLLWKLRCSWLSERYEQWQLMALLRMDVINYSVCRPKEPVVLDDLLPSAALPSALRCNRVTQKVNRKTRNEIANAWRRFGIAMASEGEKCRFEGAK